MVKLVICAEIFSSDPFPFTTNLYQQENSDKYLKISVINNSGLVVGRTAETSYRI